MSTTPVRAPSAAILGIPMLLAACPADRMEPMQTSFGSFTTTSQPGTEGGESGGAQTGGATSADAESGPASGSSGASATTAGSSGEGPKYDVGTELDLRPPSSGVGCTKIDFLFVVDNSGSMSEEQAALTNSFPGFITEIQDTVMAEDYHIMVIDTDASAGGGCFNSICCNVDCNQWCVDCLANGCQCMCNNAACPVPPTDDCDATLGGGKVNDPGGAACGVQGMSRYMVDGQPNLSTTFECLATVGTGGDGNEKPMEAMIEAITTLNGVDQCNESFLRDDAILVVTFITDEEDVMKSAGDPASWKADVVAAKGGVETAAVVLGLFGEPGGPPCEADPSQRLFDFATSFTYGSWGTICAADYTPFFHDAVSVIDTACDEFEPPG